MKIYIARFPRCRAQSRPDGDSCGYSRRVDFTRWNQAVAPFVIPGFGPEPLRDFPRSLFHGSRVQPGSRFPARATFSTTSWVRSQKHTFSRPPGLPCLADWTHHSSRREQNVTLIFDFQIPGGHRSSQIYPDQDSTSPGLHFRDGELHPTGGYMTRAASWCVRCSNPSVFRRKYSRFVCDRRIGSVLTRDSP